MSINGVYAEDVDIQVIVEAEAAWLENIRAVCPPGRELSLALTNIQQASMWAIAAIGRGEARAEKPTNAGVPPHMPPEWHNPAYRNKV